MPKSKTAVARKAPAAKKPADVLLALPKVDIHCHLDGSLRPATILELARERRIKLPADNVKDLTPFVQVSPTCRSLKEFIDVFDVFLPVLTDAKALERVAYELCADCAADNIRHVEARFAPALNCTSKFSMEEVVEAAIKGLRRGLKDFGVTSGVIVCLIRSHGPAQNRGAFDVAKKLYRPENGLARPGVVGIDLAGDEAQFPTILFSEFFEEARRLGIPATCHAGETVGTANLRAALELQVRRIGHGTHLFDDATLVREVIRRKVPLEVGLTSNLLTKSIASLKAHPVRRFLEEGVPFSLNTDDRGVMGITLTHEYEAARDLGFSIEELARIATESVDHLFLPEADRAVLRRRFEQETARLLGS